MTAMDAVSQTCLKAAHKFESLILKSQQGQHYDYYTIYNWGLQLFLFSKWCYYIKAASPDQRF